MARAPATQDIEAPPEADRFEPYPHPRHTKKLFGHAKAEAALGDVVGSGRIHHAWLLTGPEGIGKATLAWRLATFLLAGEGHRKPATLDIDPAVPAARQVAALSHPSLLLIRRPWDHTNKRIPLVIPVEEVRRIKGFLSHSGDGTNWRVVIVDRVDELNPSAANALLKSLEEPPKRVVFILVSSMPGRLLPTIRSRCRTLELSPLNASDLAAAVAQARGAAGLPNLAETDAQRLAILAKGSTRRLLGLAENGGLEAYEQLRALLASLPRLDRARLHVLADQLTASGADARFQTFLDLLSDLIARLVRAKAAGDTADPDARLAEQLMASASPVHFAEVWNEINTLRAETEVMNLDRKALLLEAFARLEQASRA